MQKTLEGCPKGPPRLRAFLEGWMDWIDQPELPGGYPIAAACFELDDREGAPRETLVAIQRALREAILQLFAPLAPPEADREQLAFEFKAITLAYHHASRVFRDPLARPRARQALEGLLARIASPGMD